MKARVHVMLKDGVLDPQGEAVRHALWTLVFAGVNAVRQGKVIELDLAATDRCRSGSRAQLRPSAVRPAAHSPADTGPAGQRWDQLSPTCQASDGRLRTTD